MRTDEFVMRGRTDSTSGANTEVLNFSGFKPGYAYKLVEFSLYPMTPHTGGKTLVGTIVAGLSLIHI